MRAQVQLAVALGALAIGSAACGGDGSATAPAVALKLSVRDGHGKVASATLTCDGTEAHGTGFLAQRAPEHCRTTRDLERLLRSPGVADRVCTQIYGGPQTAHISGTLAGHAVERDLGRHNGCEIADWRRAAPLLDASGIRAGAGP